MTGTAGVFRQFQLLIWKNFVLRRRRPLFLILELLSPVAIIAVLALVRTRNLRINELPCHLRPVPMPSAGTLPWLQHALCNFNNTCFTAPLNANNNNSSGNGTFNSTVSLLTDILRDGRLSSSNTDGFTSLTNIGDILAAISRNASERGHPLSFYLTNANATRSELEQEANITFSDTGWTQLGALSVSSAATLLTRPLTLINVLEDCNATAFVIFLNVSSVSEVDELHNSLCNLTNVQIFQFTRVMSLGVDLQKIANESTNTEAIDRLRAERTNLQNSGDSILSILDDMLTVLRDLMPSGNANNSSNSNGMLAMFKLACGEDSDLYRLLDKYPDMMSSNLSDTVKPGKNQTTEQSTTAASESDSCNKMFNEMPMQLLLRGLKPLLTSKVYYTPNNEITQSFVKNSNSTFDGLVRFTQATTQWRTQVSDNIRTQMYNGSFWNFLRTICPSLNRTELCDFLINDPSDPDQLNWQKAMDQLDSAVKQIEDILVCFNFDKFVPMESEVEMLAVMNKEDDYWAGIVFDNLPDSLNATVNDVNHVSIRIRMNTSMVDGTVDFKVLDRYWRPGTRRNPLWDLKYFTYGFIYLQEMLGQGVSKTMTGQEVNHTVQMQQFPYPCYVNDRFTNAIARSLPMFLVLGWIVSISMTVRAIVYEKEHRMKEIMKVMGLSNGVHWLGWFTTTAILMTSSAIIITAVMHFGKVLYFSSGLVVFFFIFSFMFSSIMQAFLISVFFGKANIAAVCAGILYFVFYLPFIVVQINEEVITEGALYGLSLFAQVSFSIGCRYLAQYEQQGIGIQFSNIWVSPGPDDPFNLGKCIGMLWLDALLYWFATWYIEAVFPGTFGVPRVWYFPVTRDYWCGTETKSMSNCENKNSTELEDSDKKYFEQDPVDGVIGVSIQNMVKTYKKGMKPAVDGLNLNFYENQITSFLGHNGAGKTTTISILTGLFTPTSGTAYIYGRDITTDMDAIRHNLGLCPQHNVLFEYLNVEEHIYFYGLLKGMTRDQIKDEIDTFVKAVGLPHKRKELSMKLSGGMKRKLSVAMAFVGGSKVVILDEPTAGVDPYARRSIWDLLVSCRKDRTIILTTHHMDEADVLGDRIAIISQGSLKCCGSTVFLKNLIGSGYHLILAKSDSIVQDETVTVDHTAKLTEFIESYVTDSELVEDTKTEWLYQLPRSGLNNGEYQSLFGSLDSKLADLGISSYGISDTSLEEVFLKVAHDPSDEFTEASIEKLTTDGGTHPRPVSRGSFRSSQRRGRFCLPLKRVGNSKVELIVENGQETVTMMDTVNSGAGSYQLSGFALLRMQFFALWVKRFHNMKRNKRGFVAELVVPTLFILLAVVLSSVTPGVRQNPAMKIQPWLLAPKRGDDHLVVFYSNANTTDSVTQQLSSMIRTPLGLGGIRCMNSTYTKMSEYTCSLVNNSTGWSPVPKDEIPLVIPFCNCNNTGNLECPQQGVVSPKPSSRLMETSDYLMNLTGFNESDWILSTTDEYIKRRFGGFVFGWQPAINVGPIVAFTQQIFGNSAVSQNDSNFWENVSKFFQTAFPLSPHNATVWFDNKGYVASVAYLSILQNNLMRLDVSEEKAPNFGFSFVNHPMNLSEENILDSLYRVMAVDMLVSICVVFALAFIPASFLLFLIEERVSNSKHLQFVSGINPYIYWIANYLWDIVNYIIPCFICIIIFCIFDRQSYISKDNVGTFILLLMIYGITIIPLMYQTSFFFSTPSTAFVVVSSINLMLGLLSTLAVFIIESLEEEDPEMETINKILKKVFLVLPQYCLGRGLFELSQMNIYSTTFEEFTEFKERLAWENIGKNIFALCIQCIFFIIFVFLIERNCCCRQRQGRVKPEFLINSDEQDDDVVTEQERVTSGNADRDPVRLVNLTKVYPGKKNVRPAVNSLSLSVRSGECFGFLGVNGAGKTTTFKMLTGQESVTKGDAAVGGFSVISDLISVHQRIGYCPQFDALNNLLTGRETLWMYARLRGIPKHEIGQVVDWALSRLSLIPHADKPAGMYSGGNKRKLSTAVALIGNPSVIFLDEPTSGMDPGARRFLWNCILQIVKEGRSVVLTTHSMEECEALSQRLCIMVNGVLRCIGSVQHLKTKFGKGYMLALKLNNVNPRYDEAVEFMSTNLPEAVLGESNYTLLQYQLPSDLKLGDIFAQLQIAKTDLCLLDDYSVSQTTLDQVFINFAKDQSDMQDDEGEVVNAPTKPVNGLSERNGSHDFRDIECYVNTNLNKGTDDVTITPL